MKVKKSVIRLIVGMVPLLIATAAGAAGSVQAGSTKSLFCAACHGMDGNVAYASARLAGQSTARFQEGMMAYKAGKRVHPVMNILSLGLTEQDVQDLAMYYAAQKPLDLKDASLYWRLGGQDAINGAVDELIKVSKVDKRLTGRDLGDCTPRLQELLCEAAGGPCAYTGQDMKTAPEGMKMTEAEFEAVADNLAKILGALNVAEQDELADLTESMKGDIVCQ